MTLIIIKILLLASIIFVTQLLIKPVKIALCKAEICGVIVDSNHVKPIFKGGSLLEWATPNELMMDELGNLVEVPPGEKKPYHPGAELGIWWTGWLSPLYGITFPTLLIESVRKKKGVSPDEPITRQFERRVEPISELRRNINRFMVFPSIEMKDGSKINVVIYATGGVVVRPGDFWIKHATNSFAIWESATSRSVSAFFQQKTFEETFRGDARAYTEIEHELDIEETLNEAISLIGLDPETVSWHMEAWEEDVSDAVKQARQKATEAAALAKAKQIAAEGAVITAEKETAQKEAEAEVAKAENKRVLALAGDDPKAKTMAVTLILARDAGINGAEVLRQLNMIEERRATPALSTLIEAGAETKTQVQVPITQTPK